MSYCFFIDRSQESEVSNELVATEVEDEHPVLGTTVTVCSGKESKPEGQDIPDEIGTSPAKGTTASLQTSEDADTTIAEDGSDEEMPTFDLMSSIEC